MKRIYLLCLCFCLTLFRAEASSVLNKSEKLTPDIFTVEEWLQVMKKKGYQLFFLHSQLDLSRPIRLTKHKGTVASLLKDILREQPLDLKEIKGRVFIVRKKVIPPVRPEPKGTEEVVLCNFKTLGIKYD